MRQLADWGANVIIKNEAVPDQAGSEFGGPPYGSDFRNPHIGLPDTGNPRWRGFGAQLTRRTPGPGTIFWDELNPRTFERPLNCRGRVPGNIPSRSLEIHNR